VYHKDNIGWGLVVAGVAGIVLSLLTAIVGWGIEISPPPKDVEVGEDIELRIAGIKISPPPEDVEVGEDIELRITGIDYKEIQGAKLIYYPREKVKVRDTLSWQLVPRIDFRAMRAGSYFVAVAAEQDGKLVYDEVVVVVGGGPGPDPPDPTPEPDPPLPLPGDLWAVTIYETGQRTGPSGERLKLLHLYLDKAEAAGEIQARYLDQDTQDATTGNTPEWFRPVLQAVRDGQVKLPAVVIAVRNPDTGIFTPVDTTHLDNAAVVMQWIKTHIDARKGRRRR